MDSAFGIDHGGVSKGLPRAVQNGGGGTMGALMRKKNIAGKTAARGDTNFPGPMEIGLKRTGQRYKNAIKIYQNAKKRTR